MDPKKRARLERAGWKLGSAQDFLGLSEVEAAIIDIRARLAKALAGARARRRLSQVEVAQRIGSSQSRVAKMEAADPTVSVDLLLRTLLALGERRGTIGKIIANEGRRKG